MSLPVAISVWFLLPDFPHNTEAWYISEEDKQLALERSAKQGKASITGKLDLALAKRMFGNWRWWVLCIMYIFVSQSHVITVRDSLPGLIPNISTATLVKQIATSPSIFVSTKMYCVGILRLIKVR